MPVVYVRNALVASGQATMVAISTTSLAFPVTLIAVGLMALWHYLQQMSLGACDSSPDPELPVLQGQQGVVRVHAGCLCMKYSGGHWTCNNDGNLPVAETTAERMPARTAVASCRRRSQSRCRRGCRRRLHDCVRAQLCGSSRSQHGLTEPMVLSVMSSPSAPD